MTVGHVRGSVLLLHGSTSSRRTWWKVGPEVKAQGFHVEIPDLPGHGSLSHLDDPVEPVSAAAHVAGRARGRFDVVVGHSFGAATALALACRYPQLVGTLVLEELPGRNSVDWTHEAAEVLAADPADPPMEEAIRETAAANPTWDLEDCRHAVADLARCNRPQIATGLALGRTWPALTPDERPPLDIPVHLLLATDEGGINRGDPGTALRGNDRVLAVHAAESSTVLPGGHCLHRDSPGHWIEAVLAAAGQR